jgi:Flp pilus assembly protein protease CpaA
MSGDWLSSVVLPLAIGIPFFIGLLLLNYKNIMGMGDVKLILAMCLSLSWKTLWVWVALPVAIAIGIAISLLVVILKQKYKESLALAPIAFVAYALLIAILFIN